MTSEQVKLTQEVFKALKEPFKAEYIQWRPVAFSHDKNRALVVPFYDARMVIIRLDEIVGPSNWMVSHAPLDGGGVLTTISIRDGDHWISKEDIGYVDRDTDKQTGEQIDSSTKIKGDASDGIKRAGMLWGIGRVYWMFPPAMKEDWWVDWDSQYRKLAGPPPTLPKWALPYTTAPDPAEKPTEAGSGDPESGEKPETTGKQPEPDKPASRPYDPASLKLRLVDLIAHYEATGEPASKSKMGLFMGMLRHALEAKGYKDPDKCRKAVLQALFEVDTGTKLSQPMVLAGLKWAEPVKDETGKTVPSANFIQEVADVYMLGPSKEA
jgi:hypothetical protein